MTKILLNLGIKKINKVQIQKWLVQNKIDLITSVLRNKNSSNQLIVLRCLRSKYLNQDLIQELINIICHAEMHLAHIANRILQEYTNSRPALNSKIINANEVYEKRAKTESNYENYLGQIRNVDQLLVDNNRMQHLNSSKKQRRSRMGKILYYS